jgi:SAM-dependent methyltransferase
MEATAAHWNEVWANTQVAAPHDTVLATIEQLRPASILEIGAGSGRDLEELIERGYNVRYSDFSATAVQKFRSRHPSVQSDEADARTLPYEDGEFDLVYSLGLLEHFDAENRARIIREKFRVSRRFVLIDVPQRLAPAFVIKKAMMATGRWSYGDETEFSYGELVREVLRAVETARPVASYGRELVPLPRNRKQVIYGRMPEVVRSAFVASHRYFARAGAGSLGLVFAKQQNGTAVDVGP